MLDITISDGKASVTLNVKDDALKLSTLKTGLVGFTDLLKLAEPKIDLGGKCSIVVKEDHWMLFQATNQTRPAVCQSRPALECGRSECAAGARLLYSIPNSAPEPTLIDAIGETISNFAVLRSGAGSMKLGGSFSLPLVCNQLSLADEKLPFNEKVPLSPALKMTVSGAVTLNGEFRFRARHTDAATFKIGLYKKRETTLSASFSEGAGIVADVGCTDLIAALFGAVAPKVDTKRASIPAAGSDAIKKAMKDRLANSLSIGVNAECSPSTAHVALCGRPSKSTVTFDAAWGGRKIYSTPAIAETAHARAQ